MRISRVKVPEGEGISICTRMEGSVNWDKSICLKGRCHQMNPTIRMKTRINSKPINDHLINRFFLITSVYDYTGNTIRKQRRFLGISSACIQIREVKYDSSNREDRGRNLLEDKDYQYKSFHYPSLLQRFDNRNRGTMN